MLRVLQVCNVGEIVGGTAACAWTVTRSLPAFDHTVVFLNRVSRETVDVFCDCRVEQWNRVSASRVAAVNPDVVILHNTARSRADDRLPAVTIQYLHSKIDPAPTDLTLYCSNWLARRVDGDLRAVCLQAVPKPKRVAAGEETRSLREAPVIGRICTPQQKKWPAELPEFYAMLTERFPQVLWEFVGCPSLLRRKLQEACQGNAEFFPASWHIRSRLWQWNALLYHNPAVTESFGRTVAEAMRAGCIPMVDDRGGFSEQVPDRCGYLCRRETDFADAIEQILSPGHRLRISRACQAHADEAFSLFRFGRDLLDRFQEAIQSCAAASVEAGPARRH